MPLKILLAEDEEQLSHVYATALRHKGFTVTQVSNGLEAVKAAKTERFDVMILDIMMPIMTGLEALEEIRASGDKTHIIMLTAMAELDDKISGLSAGADDYLTKPISIKELLARIESLERRLAKFSSPLLSCGTVTLNLAEQELSSHNAVRLAGKEVRLMELFMLNPGKALSTEELFNQVWAGDGDDSITDSYVWVYVSYLRQKLKAIHADVTIEGEQGGDFTLVEVGD
ncbi:response regulator transcription factor [Streptococcus caprae]|uniref:Response regulator transcription factor n=1 Tax=Streptococcus caprae TaxID=1640501 RepID=A0ABV8CX89_9STRE